MSTDAYLGLEARAVEVQVQLSTGIPRFVIVGLPDKAVAKSRARVRAALTAIGLAIEWHGLGRCNASASTATAHQPMPRWSASCSTQ